MIKQAPEQHRELQTRTLEADLVVVGGGLAGTCCALTAARAGIRVILVQDRPILGGNAGSEVRLWTLGATAHMQNNNRWAREGGVIDEILVENMFRNPEGNPLIFDTILLEKVVTAPGITLLLNTAVYEATKGAGDHIESVTAFCPQNATHYHLRAPLFCDASGDGIVGFLAGAAFRMGAESRDEFGEKFAPTQEYGHLLGHSIYFYSKDLGRPVRFVPPTFALDDVTGTIPRFRSFNAKTYGCRLWWIEYGGRLDTVHDTEQIKWELWKVVYGVWDYIKNSGKFPDAETLTLEWVGHIPGKRESRRFEGDYLLTQQDIIEQRHHADAVAFGGWSIDLHPADGVFSERPGCNQWHSKGLYEIPYRCCYSRNIPNLFLAGRLLSATHVAFGSSRVMATCSHAGQAVGIAAALCTEQNLLPSDLRDGEPLRELQRNLLRTGQHIPGIRLEDGEDLAQTASITVSSRFRLQSLPPDGPLLPLTNSWGMMLPLPAGSVPQVTFLLDVAESGATLNAELRISSRSDNHTPDVILATRTLDLKPGMDQAICLDFDTEIDVPRYAFVCLMHNEAIQVRCSEQRVTGLLSVCNWYDAVKEVSAMQKPTDDIGVDTFAFWTPRRRPEGRNLAVSVSPPLDVWGWQNVTNGLQRPVAQPNAWVADPADPAPTLMLSWNTPQTIGAIELFFDTDYDHPMESVLMGHPESVMPFCVRRYYLKDDKGNQIACHESNHQSRNRIVLETPVQTERLTLYLNHPSDQVPATLFEIRCYATNSNLRQDEVTRDE
ncbi:MAG: FAD-dependent oxidoreductase [Fibrella sp.]|nr:FAD-dependent oxidoreductase [Armatimonadota bacterium]